MSENEIVVDNTPKRVTIDPMIRSANRARVEKDEAELRELMATRKKPDAPTEPTGEPADTPPKAETKEEFGWEKRYKDAQRYITELKAKLKEVETPPQSADEMEAWMRKYPQTSKIIKQMINDHTKGFEEEKSQLEAMRFEALRDKTEAEVMRLHPDYDKIKDDQTFHSWMEDQPKEFQTIIYDTVDQPNAVARIISLYKADKGIGVAPAKERPIDEDRLAASSTRARSAKPSIDADKTNGTIRESDIAKMTITQYQANLPAIQKAREAGKLIYDISGRK
jgi:hypothetical protein